jgi:hypothetical protein
MEPELYLQCSQEPATWHDPDPDERSPYPNSRVLKHSISRLKTLIVVHLVKNYSGFNGGYRPETDEISPHPRYVLKNSLFPMSTIAAQLASNSTAFYISWTFIAVSMAHTLSQINPSHILTYCFAQIYFVTSYHLRLGPPADLCLSRFLPEFVHAFLIVPMRATSPAHLIFLDLNTRMYSWHFIFWEDECRLCS